MGSKGVIFFYGVAALLYLIVGDRVHAIQRNAADANHIFSGTTAVAEFGRSLAAAGDMDSDGYDDVVVGAPGAFDQGRVFIFSGKTGQLFKTLQGPASASRFGYAVSRGGRMLGMQQSVLVSDPFDRSGYVGKVYVYGLNSTAPLMEWNCDGIENQKCGWAIAGGCDLDSDGNDDVIVGALDGGSNGAGKIFVYSGAHGNLLWSKQGAAHADQFGDKISCAGDVNQDGFDDVIVGAWGNDSNGSQSGAAYVYSGRDAELLYEFKGGFNDTFGYSVGGGGDLNGDGYDDVVVGAPSNNRGYAAAFSGRTGEILFHWNGYADLGLRMGSSVAIVADQDADGRDEVLIGDSSYDSYRGQVSLFSGTDGTLIDRYIGENDQIIDDNYFGESVAFIGDANRDGGWDFVIGAPQNDQGGTAAGRVYLFYGAISQQPPPPPPPDGEAGGGGNGGGTENPPPPPPPDPEEPQVCPVCPEPVVCPPAPAVDYEDVLAWLLINNKSLTKEQRRTLEKLISNPHEKPDRKLLDWLKRWISKWKVGKK